MGYGSGAAAASGEEKGQGMRVFFGNHGGVPLEVAEECFGYGCTMFALKWNLTCHASWSKGEGTGCGCKMVHTSGVVAGVAVWIFDLFWWFFSLDNLGFGHNGFGL